MNASLPQYNYCTQQLSPVIFMQNLWYFIRVFYASRLAVHVHAWRHTYSIHTQTALHTVQRQHIHVQYVTV